MRFMSNTSKFRILKSKGPKTSDLGGFSYPIILNQLTFYVSPPNNLGS